MRRFGLVCFVSGLVGCKKAPTEPIVAQYKDKYLTRSEALSRLVIPAGADTALLLHRYGAEWIKQQALADTAYVLLPQLRSAIEAQVQEYRTKLFITYLSRLLMEQAVQAVPDDSTLQAAYAAQPQAFQALQPYYRYRWTKVPETWNTLRELQQLVYQSDSVWIAWLQKNSYTGEVVTQWVPRSRLDSLQAFFTTPLAGLTLRATARATRIEGAQRYILLFQLTGLILPGQVLPFELVQEQLRTILIQRQIHAWLSAFEDSLYQRALARPDVHLY